MFGKKPKEPNPSEISELPEDMFSPSTALDVASPTDEDTELFTKSVKEPQPEMVNIVEKISGILSPYFIVIVGLFLYEDNFLIGMGLVAIGILSLLKVSLKDVTQWVNQLLAFFGVNKNS